MLREQRIMERIKNELGDELNEYITTFNGCDFWKIKEGEVIVNKTFKRLLGSNCDEKSSIRIYRYTKRNRHSSGSTHQFYL